MTSLNRILMADGSEFALSEWLHQPVWSTIEFASTAPVNLRAFNYRAGQNVSSSGLPRRIATGMDTNLVRQRAMNQDEALLCFGITVEFFSMANITYETEGPVTNTVTPAPALSATDLRRLQRDLMLEIFVGAGLKKPQFDAPLGYYGSSMGISAAASGDSNATTLLNLDHGTAGRASATNQQQLTMPLYIGGFGDNAMPGNAMTFFAKIYNAYGGAIAGLRQSVRMRVVCDGLKKRPA
jgi:hypothetical protein